MLTFEKFDNWLYDRDMPQTILLCQGVAPEKLAEKNPEFAKVYRSCQSALSIASLNAAT